MFVTQTSRQPAVIKSPFPSTHLRVRWFRQNRTVRMCSEVCGEIIMRLRNNHANLCSVEMMRKQWWISVLTWCKERSRKQKRLIKERKKQREEIILLFMMIHNHRTKIDTQFTHIPRQLHRCIRSDQAPTNSQHVEFSWPCWTGQRRGQSGTHPSEFLRKFPRRFRQRQCKFHHRKAPPQ